MANLNITISEILHKKFKSKVAREGKLIKEVIPELMEKYVKGKKC